MSTLTAQWAPAIAAVRLTMNLTHDLVSLDRADANGLHSVRTEGNWTPSGVTVLDDYEAALTGPVSYTIVTSAEIIEFTCPPAPETLPIIHAVTDPARRFQAESITAWNEESSWQSTISPIIGNPYPRALLGPLTARSITLSVLCDYSAARALRASMDGPYTYMARQQDHPGMDVWFAPSVARIAPVQIAGADTTWEVVISAVELDWPIGSLRSLLGRAYGDDLNSAPTYRASMMARPLYTDRQAMTNG